MAPCSTILPVQGTRGKYWFLAFFFFFFFLFFFFCFAHHYLKVQNQSNLSGIENCTAILEAFICFYLSYMYTVQFYEMLAFSPDGWGYISQNQYQLSFWIWKLEQSTNNYITCNYYTKVSFYRHALTTKNSIKSLYDRNFAKSNKHRINQSLLFFK